MPEWPVAFIRMRSPSNAPPVLRRDGSTASTAMRSVSRRSRRSRRTSSSVRDDLPDPPVPVMPTTGGEVTRSRAIADLGEQRGAESAVLDGGDDSCERALGRLRRGGVEIVRRRAVHAGAAVRDHVVDHAPAGPGCGRPPGNRFGRRRAHEARATSSGDDDSAAAAEHADCGAPAFAQHVHHVLEVLDVATLVRAHRNGVSVLVQCRDHDLPPPNGCARGG